MSPVLTLMPERLAICRLETGAPPPAWAWQGRFCAVTRTPDELSVVCEEAHVPAHVQQAQGWRGFRFQGPLAFSMTGVLAAVLRPLAEAGISVFALSTYDTDYLLVRQEQLPHTCTVLRQAGYVLEGETPETADR